MTLARESAAGQPDPQADGLPRPESGSGKQVHVGGTPGARTPDVQPHTQLYILLSTGTCNPSALSPATPGPTLPPKRTSAMNYGSQPLFMRKPTLPMDV